MYHIIVDNSCFFETQMEHSFYNDPIMTDTNLGLHCLSFSEIKKSPFTPDYKM